ncbi:MAG: hypothetical protein ACRCVV_06715 [Shewanella sp.]
MRHELHLLQQENHLSCQLARELITQIETVPYQQNTIELKLLALLACSQQKNHCLIHLMQTVSTKAVESQRIRQFQFSQRLSQLVSEWQQHREMNKLERQFIPHLKYYLFESQLFEQDFYREILQKISLTTSAALDRNRHAQNPSEDNSQPHLT